jgi:hypothetical protein
VKLGQRRTRLFEDCQGTETLTSVLTLLKSHKIPALLLVEWWNLGFMSNSVLAPCGREAGTSFSCFASSRRLPGCQVLPTIGTMAEIRSGHLRVTHLSESRPSPPIQCRTSPPWEAPAETDWSGPPVQPRGVSSGVSRGLKPGQLRSC